MEAESHGSHHILGADGSFAEKAAVFWVEGAAASAGIRNPQGYLVAEGVIPEGCAIRIGEWFYVRLCNVEGDTLS